MVDQTIIKRWMLENSGNVLYDSMHDDVFTGYVTWTPERAASALENNTKNRKVDPRKQLQILKKTISLGKWDDNVSKINFDKNGVLSDGQHRLIACVETGIPIRVLTTWGVKETAQRLTDRRGSRTFSDDLSIDGYKNTNSLAAMARYQYFRESGMPIEKILKHGMAMSNIPDFLLDEFFTGRDKDLIEKNKRVSRVADSVRDLKINAAVLKVLVPEFDSVSESDADCFWGRLSNGITTQENDPVILLRKRLSANARSETGRLPNHVVAALIIKAWNFFEKGVPCGTLKFSPGGANPEEFPQIYNPYEGGQNA